MTYEIVWEFRVSLSRRTDFEATYGSDGPWARLFERAAGFTEVKLLQCTEQDGRYLTIDRWESHSAFETFRREFAVDYEALDERLEGLAITEARIGAFHVPKGNG